SYSTVSVFSGASAGDRDAEVVRHLHVVPEHAHGHDVGARLWRYGEQDDVVAEALLGLAGLDAGVRQVLNPDVHRAIPGDQKLRRSPAHQREAALDGGARRLLNAVGQRAFAVRLAQLVAERLVRAARIGQREDRRAAGVGGHRLGGWRRAGWLRRDGRRRRDGGWLERGRGERQQDQDDHRRRRGVRTAQFDFLRRVAGRADRQENRVVLVQLDRVEREPAGFVGSRLESGGVRRIVRRGIRERNLSIRQRDGEAVLDDAHVSDQRHAAEFF